MKPKPKSKSDSVRTSISLPRKLHRQLREVAARKGCSASQLVRGVLERMVAENIKLTRPIGKKRLDLNNPPLVPAAGRGPIGDFTNEELYDLIEFP